MHICNLCKYETKSKSHYTRHCNQAHKYSCSQCDQQFLFHKYLIEHYLSEHPLYEYTGLQCPWCNYTSIRRDHYRRHCKTKHNFECEFCNKKFFYKRDLIAHLNQDLLNHQKKYSKRYNL